jgi:hypothetical protein
VSFATAAALLVGLLVAAPVIAHLLRRGKTKEREFPPARLVPAIVITSKQRAHLEDRVLLLLRGLMVLALAVLGATPFVRCSDLSVDRKSGASVALAIVVDDSQSMRAETAEGETRFELAKRGAEQLLQSARKGDVIAIVGAGHPARLLVNATPDLHAAREALERLEVSDRGTDLSEAVALARSAVKELPHADKRVVLLSDMAVRHLASGDPAPWAPLEPLREPVDNCGIANARRHSAGVVATIGCSSPEAARGRELQVLVADETDKDPLASIPLQPRTGVQQLDVKVDGMGLELAVKLSGKDAIASDNLAQAAKEQARLVIGVSADASKASAITGGPTVVEQALKALDADLDVRPMTGMPESAEDLKRFAAVIVDDPPGFSPEERAALIEWLEQGGVALGLLGPASANTQLASSIEPFARDGVQWEATTSVGITPKSVDWLGKDALSLATLVGGGRVRLDAADLPGTAILGSWEDGVPWLFRRDLERGVVFTVGSPASLDQSDFALRPGFLALLDVLVERARQSSGLKVTKAGVPWLFPGDADLVVKGPDGKKVKEEYITTSSAPQKRVSPGVTGRYQIKVDGVPDSRLVVLDSDELVLAPIGVEELASAATAESTESDLDISPHWALALLGLFTFEMLMRVYGSRLKPGARRRGEAASA